MNRALLKKQLELHEGVRHKPYLCTADKLTIGVGRNLDDVGLTADEIDYLLENDIDRCCMDLDRFLPTWYALSMARQHVLIDMIFNLGLTRLNGFKRFKLALENKAYARAADEMLDSRWAKQVGKRAIRLANAMRNDTLVEID